MQPFRTQIVTASQGHIRRWAHVTAFRKVPAGVLKLVDKLDLGSSAYGVWVRVPSPAQTGLFEAGFFVKYLLDKRINWLTLP